MKNLENFHLITVSYLCPTNTKGSRVKITSERFKQSKIISYDYRFNNSMDCAQNWLIENNFIIIGQAEGKKHDYIITRTFMPLR